MQHYISILPLRNWQVSTVQRFSQLVPFSSSEMLFARAQGQVILENTHTFARPHFWERCLFDEVQR